MRLPGKQGLYACLETGGVFWSTGGDEHGIPFVGSRYSMFYCVAGFDGTADGTKEAPSTTTTVFATEGRRSEGGTT